MAQMMETEKVDDFEDKVRAMLQRPSKPVNSVTSVKPPNVYWVDRRIDPILATVQRRKKEDPFRLHDAFPSELRLKNIQHLGNSFGTTLQHVGIRDLLAASRLYNVDICLHRNYGLPKDPRWTCPHCWKMKLPEAAIYNVWRRLRNTTAYAQERHELFKSTNFVIAVEDLGDWGSVQRKLKDEDVWGAIRHLVVLIRAWPSFKLFDRLHGMSRLPDNLESLTIAFNTDHHEIDDSDILAIYPTWPECRLDEGLMKSLLATGAVTRDQVRFRVTEDGASFFEEGNFPFPTISTWAHAWSSSYHRKAKMIK